MIISRMRESRSDRPVTCAFVPCPQSTRLNPSAYLRRNEVYEIRTKAVRSCGEKIALFRTATLRRASGSARGPAIMTSLPNGSGGGEADVSQPLTAADPRPPTGGGAPGADLDAAGAVEGGGMFGRIGRWYRGMVARRSALRAGALRNYGIAAILSYGFFDLLTYTISFLFSLRAFLASGKTLTWQTLPQVLALMWGINNLSRPFRIAGALALAPVVDRRVVKPVSAFFSRVFSRDSAKTSSPSPPSPSTPPPPPPPPTSPPSPSSSS